MYYDIGMTRVEDLEFGLVLKELRQNDKFLMRERIFLAQDLLDLRDKVNELSDAIDKLSTDRYIDNKQ